MPVRFGSDEKWRRHDNDDYSFTTRSDTSRDFARRRRYGYDDENDHAMSQVSSPLRLPQLGNTSRRSYSPFEDQSTSRRGRAQRDASPLSSSRRSKLSGAARQALAVCGELDEDDAYYKARRSMTSQSPGGFDDDKDEEYEWMTSQSRQKRKGNPYLNDEDREFLQRRRAVTLPLMDQEDVEIEEQRQRAKKRDYTDDSNLGYVMPVSRRRPDDVLAEEEPAMRELSSYIATRRQFAVEDDDVLQKLKNQKYQYRTRGPNRRSHEGEDDVIHRRDRFARAPMFDMKLRSHVIWEKMYVKFTCTIRGSPEPKVTWYHNMVPIEPMMMQPGVVKISNQFGVHTLEIFKACLDDSGTYRISAQNHKGEISSYATLLVRRYDGGKIGYYDVKSGYNMKKPTDYPDVENLNVPDAKSTERDSSTDEPITNKDVSTKVKYSGTSQAVGEGKYESVLEFRIPGNNQPLEEKHHTLEETMIEPFEVSRNESERRVLEGNGEHVAEKNESVATKVANREELSGCLNAFNEPTAGEETDDVNRDDFVSDVIEAKRMTSQTVDDKAQTTEES